MKVSRRDGSKERTILINLIVSKYVLGQLSSKWDGKLFRSNWANIVADWCFKYFDKYGRAPRKRISNLYEGWAADNDDADTVKLVEKFLAGLSDEYAAAEESTNYQYVVDLASEWFNEVRTKRMAERVIGAIDAGDMIKAESLITKYSRIELGLGSSINVLQDVKAVEEAHSEQVESVVKYGDALGEFFGDCLARDSLVSFMGPEKRGKSWWLIDLAWMGMLQRRRVAFFAVGDMSQNQMMRRFGIRAARRPWKPKTFRYPTSINRDPDAIVATVDFEDREETRFLSKSDQIEAFNKVQKKIKSKNPYLKLSTHPNDSISIVGIEAILKGWQRTEDWVPDIVVIDYADILAPPLPGAHESRDQINATWKKMRGLSQSWHCLVVTATQSDAASYDAHTLGRKHFSEDKRKMAHVSAMVGLNATEEEKEQQLMRLNFVVLREDDFITLKCVHVAGCLSLGRPAILSTF